jgi:hypothetical protein
MTGTAWERNERDMLEHLDRLDRAAKQVASKTAHNSQLMAHGKKEEMVGETKRKKKIAECAECGRTMKIHGRGLCGSCYSRRRLREKKAASKTAHSSQFMAHNKKEEMTPAETVVDIKARRAAKETADKAAEPDERGMAHETPGPKERHQGRSLEMTYLSGGVVAGVIRMDIPDGCIPKVIMEVA